MSCRYDTPEGKHQQVHIGKKIGAGVFSDEGHEDVKDSDHTRICVHGDEDGLTNPPKSVTIVTKDVLSGAEAPAPVAPSSPSPSAGRGARRSKRGAK